MMGRGVSTGMFTRGGGQYLQGLVHEGEGRIYRDVNTLKGYSTRVGGLYIYRPVYRRGEGNGHIYRNVQNYRG